MRLIIIFFYLFFLLMVALKFKGRNSSFLEYVLGDRSFGIRLSSLGLLGNYIGGGTLLAVVGHVAIFGLSDVWVFLGAILSFVILGLLGKGIRNSESITLPEFVGKAFGKKVQFILLPFVLLAICGFLGVQLGASIVILSEIIGISKFFVMLFVVTFVIAYTWIGGIRADTFTDIVQLIIIIIGLLVSLFVLISKLNDGSILDSIRSVNNGYLLSFVNHGWKSIGLVIVLPLIVITSPTYHQRIYATRGGQVAKKSGYVAAFIYIGISILILSIGILGRIYFSGIDSYDNIIPLLIENTLNPIFGGFVLAALLAAVMSSIDSHLITASTIFFYHFRKIKKDETIHNIDSLGARLLVILFAIIGIVLANFTGNLFYLLGGTWILLVATASGPVVYAVVYPNINSKGIFIGILLGGIFSIVMIVKGISPEMLALPCASISFLIPIIVNFTLKLFR